MTFTTQRAIAMFAALVASWCAQSALAQSAVVDPKADAVLRAMTTYMADLKQFSAHTENTLEAVTTDGQKIQFSTPAAITVSRPDKLFATRRGDVVDQAFYYDGKSLTLYNPGTKHYATVAAPANIDDLLDFAATKLDVLAPGSDLFDTRAYTRLMEGVTSAAHIGMAVIGTQRCHHLAFRGAEVDWQLWVREGDKPLPCRYVITSRGIAGAPQFGLEFVKWNTTPKITASMFTFAPPRGAKRVEFLSLGSGR